jgi:hypothetical protein
MKFNTVDSIVRRTLLEKSYPIHWYAEFLFHATAALRELTIDTLKVINTKQLPINDYSAADLPDDFVDDILVSVSAGALLMPIPRNDKINPLRLHDSSTGAFIQQTNGIDAPIINNGLYGYGWGYYWNVNDYAEPTGRLFGVGGGDQRNGYKIVKERRQIQFLESIISESVVLQYISDGQSIDNATQVDILAYSTIQAYINWKRSPNADIELSLEGRAYSNMKRKLRSRLSDLSITDVKNIYRTNYHASIKS